METFPRPLHVRFELVRLHVTPIAAQVECGNLQASDVRDERCSPHDA
jgi:hypothetical protein